MKSPRNPNYAATVVALDKFVDLPNCNNVKAALIFGNSVIVGKDHVPGDIGLFFPAETQLSAEFLANNNLYRKPELGNLDPTKTGFFEQHGRVKTMKFRGNKSEGFWIPLDAVNYIPERNTFSVGATFDFVGDHEICRKYVPRGGPRRADSSPRANAPKLIDSIVDGQFRFHFDTENLRRNLFKIEPEEIISISDKWHGTSAVVSKVLVKRNLSWLERIAKRLGIAVVEQNYGLTYSSRRVIKAVNGVEKNSNHFHSEDIWGIVAKELEDKIPAGFTVYGEIVGFLPNGEPIQKGYSYGCPVGGHQFVAYRVTMTTPEGVVVELTWEQMREFAAKYNLGIVPPIYYGRAIDLFPEIAEANAISPELWREKFLEMLEKEYVNDGDCLYNPPGTPAEGIVVRIDKLEQAESYKLKNFRFLRAESDSLDKGVADIETVEAEAPEGELVEAPAA